MIDWLRRVLGRHPREKDPAVERLVEASAKQAPQVRRAVAQVNAAAQSMVDDFRKQGDFLRGKVR